MKLARFLCVAFLASCSPTADSLIFPLTTIFDAKTDKYVQLVEVSNFSSSGFAIFLIDTPKVDYKMQKSWDAIINVAGTDGAKPDFFIDKITSCYVLKVKHRFGTVSKSVYFSEKTSNSICFELRHSAE